MGVYFGVPIGELILALALQGFRFIDVKIFVLGLDIRIYSSYFSNTYLATTFIPLAIL